jgi:hypothetical protein
LRAAAIAAAYLSYCEAAGLSYYDAAISTACLSYTSEVQVEPSRLVARICKEHRWWSTVRL